MAGLLLAACGTSGGDTSSGETASPAAYRQALTAAGKPVAAALTGITSAKTLKALTQRLADAEEATGRATDQLGKVLPPEDVRAEHSDLVQGFKQLTGDVGVLRDAVEGRELCTASVVVTRLGKADGVMAVRDASKALAAKGGAEGYKLGLVVPPSPADQVGRLANGQFVRAGSRTGRGELTVDNGGDQDAVITLVSGTRPAYSVYMRKGNKQTVTGIRDGAYRVYFTSGLDWDRKMRAFSRNCSFDRFDDSLEFETTQTQYSTWTIELQAVVGGNAATSEVDPNDFPAS